MRRHNFKVGDYVIRIQGDFAGMRVGNIDVIEHIDGEGVILRKFNSKEKDSRRLHSLENLAPIQEQFDFNKGE